MGGVAKVIHVTPETKLDDLLDEAESVPVRLERGGVVYRLSREEDDPCAIARKGASARWDLDAHRGRSAQGADLPCPRGRHAAD